MKKKNMIAKITSLMLVIVFSIANFGILVHAADTQAPSIPTNLRVTTKTDISINLSWDISIDNVGVSGYEIYRNGTKVGTATGTTYTDSVSAGGTNCTYYIRAYDASNNFSGNSNLVLTTTYIKQEYKLDTTSAVLTSSTGDIGNVSNCFDGSETTLLRTTVNPAFVQVAFSEPKQIVKARVLLGQPGFPGTESDSWSLKGADTDGGTYTSAIATRSGVAGSWDQSASSLATSKKVWRFDVKRDFDAGKTDLSLSPVHIWELELWSTRFVEAVDTMAPSAPTNLNCSIRTDNSITINWNPSIDNIGIARYEIYRGATKVGNVSSTSYSDNGLTSNTLYSYAVKAFDAAGNVTSSTQINAATLANPAYKKSVTSGVSISNPQLVTDGSISGSAGVGTGIQWIKIDLGQKYDISKVKIWHNFSDARKYRDVIVQLSNDGNFATGVTTVFNNDKDNSAGQGTGTNDEYSESSTGKEIVFNKVNAQYVRIWSNGSSVSNLNEYSEVEVYAPDVTPPSNVTGIKMDSRTENSITLSWSAATDNLGVKEYLIYRNSTYIGTTALLSFSDTSLTNDSKYQYFVKASDFSGNISAASGTILYTGTLSNVAKGSSVTANASPVNQMYLNDGIVNTNNYTTVGTGLQWVRLDLGMSYNLSKIKLWHYFADSRIYKDIIVQLSNDASFATGVNTVFNNDSNNSAGQGTGTHTEYTENSAGKDITFNTVSARYIRVWSNGNTVDTSNHYVEMQVFGADVTAPTAPFGLIVSSKTENSIALSWTASTDNLGISQYDVYRNGTWIGLSTTTSYTDTGLNPNTAYNYKVKAIDNSYNSSPDSTVVYTFTLSNVGKNRGVTGSVSVANSVYATDGDLDTGKYTSVGSGLQSLKIDLGQSYYISKIKLWHYFGDVRKYRDVIVQISNDVAFAAGVTTVFNNDTDNSAGLGIGTDAEYQETSTGKEISFNKVNGRYVRLWSNGNTLSNNNHYVEVEIYAPDTTAPQAPTGVIVISKTHNSITLSWQKPADDVGTVSYDVFRGTVKIGTSNTTTYTDTGLNSATQYSYYIKAKDGVGNTSSASSVINETTFKGANTKIIVDGKDADWSLVDASKVGNASISCIKTAQDNNGLYFLVKGIDLKETNQIFLDVDNNSQSGYKGTIWTSSGADYLVEDNVLKKYKGTGADNLWQNVGTVIFAKEKNTAEFFLGFSQIGKSGSNEMKFGYERKFVEKLPSSGAMVTGNIFVTGVAPTNDFPYCVEYKAGQEFKLSFESPKRLDFDALSYKVVYNPDEFEAIDLCGKTLDIEMAPVTVFSSNVRITSYSPGTIEYKLIKVTTLGDVYAEAYNTIRFRAKTNNTGIIRYLVN